MGLEGYSAGRGVCPAPRWRGTPAPHGPAGQRAVRLVERRVAELGQPRVELRAGGVAVVGGGRPGQVTHAHAVDDAEHEPGAFGRAGPAMVLAPAPPERVVEGQQLVAGPPV